MLAGWCRSKNKPLISARPRLASAQLPVGSFPGHQSWKGTEKEKFFDDDVCWFSVFAKFTSAGRKLSLCSVRIEAKVLANNEKCVSVGLLLSARERTFLPQCSFATYDEKS
jgi:hypothetical protein